jgi:hypothetical protein
MSIKKFFNMCNSCIIALRMSQQCHFNLILAVYWPNERIESNFFKFQQIAAIDKNALKDGSNAIYEEYWIEHERFARYISFAQIYILTIRLVLFRL